MRKFAAVFLLLAFLLPATRPACADAYHAKPKLVVILVIDQFRGDYLDRYRDELKSPNGFNLFLKRARTSAPVTSITRIRRRLRGMPRLGRARIRTATASAAMNGGI